MTVRLIQVFLADKDESFGPNIFEVSGDEDRNFTCTCDSFGNKETCKHVKLVKSRTDKNNGAYPFDFVKRITTTDIKKAMTSEQKFREFIINNAKIEVY